MATIVLLNSKKEEIMKPTCGTKVRGPKSMKRNKRIKAQWQAINEWALIQM